MEIKKITPEMYSALKEPLPKEAVTQHPTKTYLSSIKAIFVTERLNDVFGCGSWTIKTDCISCNEQTGFVVVKTTLEIPEYSVSYESYGGNNNGGAGSKQFDLGDAYKGATTDGITKIGSYLGIGIDVFKGQQNAAPAQKEPCAPNTSRGAEKEPEKWLNVMDKDKNYTREWLNIIAGVKDGKISSVADVRKYYKVSKEVAASIEQLMV